MSSYAPSGRDVLAALLWLAVPVGFVALIDWVGIPYELLPNQPEQDPSFAMVMYGAIGVGGVLGSLFGLGTWLIPGRLLGLSDFRELVGKVTKKTGSPDEQEAAADEQQTRPGQAARAAVVLLVIIAVLPAYFLFGPTVATTVLATLGLGLLFGLALFGATAMRAARRGEDPRDWLVLDPSEPKGLDALSPIERPREVRFSTWVWNNRLVWFLALGIVFTVVDQGSKVWAQQNLAVLDVRPGKPTMVDGKQRRPLKRGYWTDRKLEVHLIPRTLSFNYAENPAAAFSLTGSLPDWIRRPFLVGVSTLAMLFIALWYFLQRRPDGLLMTAFALIIAGAVGNLIDRIRFGYVIDFINAYAGFIDPTYIWPTFNVADSCIVVGALSVVYRTLKPLYPEPLLADDEEAPEGEDGARSSEGVAPEGGV